MRHIGNLVSRLILAFLFFRSDKFQVAIYKDLFWQDYQVAWNLGGKVNIYAQHRQQWSAVHDHTDRIPPMPISCYFQLTSVVPPHHWSLYRSTDWGMAHADQRCCRCRHLHCHRHLLGGVPPSSPSLTNWSVNKLLSSPTNTWYIYYSVLSHSYSDSPIGFDWVSISFFSLSKLQGKAIYAMRLIALQNKFLRAR